MSPKPNKCSCVFKKELLSSDSSLHHQEHIDRQVRDREQEWSKNTPTCNLMMVKLSAPQSFQISIIILSQDVQVSEQYDSRRFFISAVPFQLDLDHLNYFRTCFVSVSSRQWYAVLFKHPRHLPSHRCRKLGCLELRGKCYQTAATAAVALDDTLSEAHKTFFYL